MVKCGVVSVRKNSDGGDDEVVMVMVTFRMRTRMGQRVMMYWSILFISWLSEDLDYVLIDRWFRKFNIPIEI